MTSRRSALSCGRLEPHGLVSDKSFGARILPLGLRLSSIKPWFRPCSFMAARRGSSHQQPWLGWRGFTSVPLIGWRSGIDRDVGLDISGCIPNQRMFWRSAGCAPSENISAFADRRSRCTWRPARSSTNVSRERGSGGQYRAAGGGSKNGLGRRRCNWIGRVMVLFLPPTRDCGNRDAEAPWLPSASFGGRCLVGAKRRVKMCDP